MNSIGKNSLIAAAVAAALASKASFALPPSTTPDLTLYAAGGSAQANAFYVAANTILTNVDSYTDKTDGTDSGSYRILFGSVRNSFTFNGQTIAAGKNVLYFYKFNGGSFTNGIAPQVGAGSTLNYPAVTAVLSAVSITGSVANTGVPTFSYTPGTINDPHLPDWGVADVEVSMFKDFNNPTGNGGGVSKNTKGGPAPTVGATTGIYDNLFGIAVTHNVTLGTNGGHPKTSFSRAEMEGIIQGTVSDWSQLNGDDNQPLAAGGIIFLDRGEGSGTKASGNQYFMGYPGDGSSAVLPFSATTNYAATSLGAVVAEAPLDIAEGSTSAIVSDLALAQSRSIRAIAVLGLENPPALHQVGGVNTYDFTKIDGIGVDTGTAGDDINGTTATSYINVVKGNYDFYYQNSFNTRSTTLGGTSPGSLFANEFKTVFSQPALVGAFNSKAFPLAVPGTLIDADIAPGVTTGVVFNTRNKVSTAPLQALFSGAVPTSREPL